MVGLSLPGRFGSGGLKLVGERGDLLDRGGELLGALALLAGTQGLSVRAITASPPYLHHVGIQTQGQLIHSGPRIVCPPPPYDC